MINEFDLEDMRPESAEAGAPHSLSWRARVAELAVKAGFQPDAVSGALIATPAVIENFALSIASDRAETKDKPC